MNLRLTDLTIRAALAGQEEKFDRAMAIREQHWAGGGGEGGDVKPTSYLTLHEVMMDRGGDVCDGLMSEHGWSEADFRYAAKHLEASGDPDLKALAQHMRAFEMYANEESQKEMTRQMGTMESFLKERGVPMLEQRTPVDRPAAPDQHPRQYGWANYPTNVRPQTIDDREARGARPGDLPLSARILDAAREMARLANAAKGTRQRNLISKYASRLRQMYARQLELEDASEVETADDDANAEMDRLVNDARDAANGAQPDDSFDSFDDWDNEDRAGSEDRAVDDVADQRAGLNLDEDIPTMPRVPRAGRRVGEDQLANPSLHSDDVPGRRKNARDDDIMIQLGKARRYAGKPGTRYSAFGKESLKESGGDLTDWLLGELDVAAKSAHSFF